jgi:hypothetical protein
MDYGPALPLDRYSIPPNNMLPTRRQNSYHAGTAISQSTRATQSIQQPAHLSIPIDNAPYEHHAWNTPSTQLAFYHGAGATPAHSSDHTRYPAGQSYLPAYTSAAAQDQFLSLYAQSNPGSFYNEPTPVAQQENSVSLCSLNSPSILIDRSTPTTFPIIPPLPPILSTSRRRSINTRRCPRPRPFLGRRSIPRVNNLSLLSLMRHGLSNICTKSVFIC